MRVAGLVGIGLLTAAGGAAQQAAPPARTWWVSLGAGYGQLDESADAGGHVALSFQSGARVLSIRVAAVASLLENLFGPSGTPDAVTDVAVLYGRGTSRGTVRGSAGIGLGAAQVSVLSSGSIRQGTWYLTLPLEAQLAWRPLRFLGVGLYAFASFNSGQSFGGLSVMLQGGRLR